MLQGCRGTGVRSERPPSGRVWLTLVTAPKIASTAHVTAADGLSFRAVPGDPTGKYPPGSGAEAPSAAGGRTLRVDDSSILLVELLKKPSYWTIQILPEGSGSAQTYRLGKRAARAIGLSAAALVILASAFFAGVLGRQDAAEELARYRAENRQLLGSLQAMERQSGQLGQALDDLSVRERRFRLVAGLPLLDPDVYSVGVGGPGGVVPADDEFFEIAPDLAREAGDVAVDLEQLLRRADLLGVSLAEAADSVGAQRERYQRLPSIWPVIAEDSWISSDFSHNRLHPTLGFRRPHTGVDISADFGSLVVATGAGRVTFAGSRSGYGGFGRDRSRRRIREPLCAPWPGRRPIGHHGPAGRSARRGSATAARRLARISTTRFGSTIAP